MGKYIYYEESPYEKGKYTISLHHDKFPFPTGTSGSFNVFLARIAGLSYADYLRMCRDEFGATLIGKKGYPVAYFEYGAGLTTLVRWLDARAKVILQRHEHPYEFIFDDAGNVVGRQFDNGEVERLDVSDR